MAVDTLPDFATLNVTGCSFAFRGARLAIRHPMTLIGGTYRQTKSDGTNETNGFNPAIEVDAHDVTFDSIAILDGGAGISVYGGWDRTKVLRSTFTGIAGVALMLWGGSAAGLAGTDDAVFEGNTVKQTEGCQAGPVGGRASEDGSVHSLRFRVANNVTDQGGRSPSTGGCTAGATGWFGVELLYFDETLIVGNDMRGGHALISLPKSNRTVIRGNTLRLGPFTGSDPAKWGAYWGVELASANDTLFESNTCIGSTGQGFCVDHNSNPARSTIQKNTASGGTALAEFYPGIGPGMRVVDNCIASPMTAIYLQGTTLPADAVVARNGPC